MSRSSKYLPERKLAINFEEESFATPLVEGDMERYEGHWRIKNSNGGIALELLMQYSLGVPSIEELIGLVMHNSLTESAKEMLLRIKQESEHV